MTAVPAHWRQTTLGDVISGFEAGRNLKAHGRKADGDEFGVLKISAVTWGEFRPDENKALLPGDAPKAHETVRAGDVLISRANTTELVGAPVLVRDDYPRLMLPDKVLRLLYRREVVDPRFLVQALRTRPVRQYFESVATGTSDSMRNLSQPKLSAAELPLPPLDEQRRIVNKLDALFERSRRAKTALDAIPPLLDKLRQSILAAAFRGDLTADWRAQNPDAEPASKLLERIRLERRHCWEQAELEKMRARGKAPAHDKWKERYADPEPMDVTGLPELPQGWAWASVEELCPGDAPVVYGIIQPGPDVPGGVPYIRPIDVRVDGSIDWESVKRTTPEIAAQYARASLKPGDVVLSIVGTIGKVAVASDDLDGANITQSSARLRPPRGMKPDYLKFALLSPLLTKQYDKHRFGNAVQRLNIEHVRALAVPLAPEREQSVILQRIGRATALNALSNVAECSMQQLQLLTSAILDKAFRGALLVPQPDTREVVHFER